MWNLSNRIAACGARAVGHVAKRLPHVHHRQANAPALLLAQPVVELRHARLRAVLAAEPDRAPANQVAHHDAVGVALADRDLVDADRLGSWRARLGQLRPHVLLLQLLDRLPVKLEFLGHVLDRGLTDSAAPRRRQSAWCRRGCRPGSPAARASRARNSGTARAAPRSPGRCARRRTTDREPAACVGRTSPSALDHSSRRPFF